MNPVVVVPTPAMAFVLRYETSSIYTPGDKYSAIRASSKPPKISTAKNDDESARELPRSAPPHPQTAYAAVLPDCVPASREANSPLRPSGAMRPSLTQSRSAEKRANYSAHRPLR